MTQIRHHLAAPSELATTNETAPANFDPRGIRHRRVRSLRLTGLALSLMLAGGATLSPMSGLGPTLAQAKDDKPKEDRKAEAKAAAESLVRPMAPVTATQPVGKIFLPEGTRFKLVLLDTLKSNKLEKNDVVHYALLEDLRGPNGVVLIPKGTGAEGVIVEAKGGRSMGRKGKLDFTIDYISTAADGKVPLRSNQSSDGKSRTGTVIAVSLLLTPLGLFMKGKSVTVPRGEIIEAYVNDTTTLNKGAFDNMTHHDVNALTQENSDAKDKK